MAITATRIIEFAELAERQYATRAQRMGVIIVYIASQMNLPVNSITLSGGKFRYAWSKNAKWHALPAEVIAWING